MTPSQLPFRRGSWEPFTGDARTGRPRPACLCIDLETPSTGEIKLRKIGAFRADTGATLVVERDPSLPQIAAELAALCGGADFLVGHNLRRHDMQALAQLLPGHPLLALPLVDTLELSAIAFPQNPYHRLVKDYKLVSDARNHPLRDAELSFELLLDIIEAFAALRTHQPDHLSVLKYLLTSQGDAGLSWIFEHAGDAGVPSRDEAAEKIKHLLQDDVCATRLETLLARDLNDVSLHWPLAYTFSWLRVAGGNSVLPPWVRCTYPQTSALVRELREQACDDPECAYCRQHHHPETLLEQWFGLPAFRPVPQWSCGESLQRVVTAAALRGAPLLAVLPTGAGKSVCYQLPALAKYWRAGKLTVVISPLQSLMKDQIDNLVAKGITCAAAINGLLTPPERQRELARICLGDAGIVLVSPEQFRNRAFIEAMRWREIGAWVFDEAHCLSKWGQDFRTDYLYVSRFIREHFYEPLAPVACYTATAKPDVVQDLRDHFRDELGVELECYIGSHERSNLEFQVDTVSRAEKAARIDELLREALQAHPGGAVVFASTRKSAETFAEHLAAMGWLCKHYHAGVPPGEKRQIQQEFVDGTLRVIVATNAFGMGVDKPDIRLVVHADVPGSLENYLQEAGRAGRDGDPARCVLLYDPEDIETQFALAARSRLTHADFVAILKALRKRSSRCWSEEVVVTAKELLLDDESEIAIDADSPDADTKVKTAIAWLERARLVRREENRTRVFPASLRVNHLAEAEARLASADLPKEARERYLAVVRLVMAAGADEGISTDELLAKAGVPASECFVVLQRLEALGVLANDLGLRAVLRKGVKDASETLFERVSGIEQALIEVLEENAPDATPGETQTLSLRPLCEAVRRRLEGPTSAAVVPERVLHLIQVMARSFGDGQSGRAMVSLRKIGAGEFHVRVQRPWRAIREIVQKRREVARVLLRALLARLPPTLKSADAVVECKASELQQALAADAVVTCQVRDPAVAVQQALLYLHETEVLILDKGRTVFRSAMTIRLLERDRQNRFLKEDFEPLARHYRERNLQIHVMNAYAVRGARKVADALALVAAYFSVNKEQFTRDHFPGQKELLEFATTAESYRRIVEALRHPVQQQLVQSNPTGKRPNRLVLAGPGSGKTTVIVHRVAYLVRVLREPPDSVIVLAFNRSAAVEVRRRLYALIGSDAAGVAVLTYHAMACRLTGVSVAEASVRDEAPDFDAVLRRAVALLEGKDEVYAEADDLRDKLLRGYRHILVDEYQDIDALQYALVSALAGRSAKEGDAKLCIVAVGDDDQNVYAFRQTSVEFIRRFESDYDAQRVYLVENFRSTQNIITAANALIQAAPDRMKIDVPIRIDEGRRRAPSGGRWEALDPLARGAVRVFVLPGNANVQAQLAMAEVERLRQLDGDADWSHFAVIARTHTALEPVRAYCEAHRIPYLSGEEGGRGTGVTAAKTREGQRVIAALRDRSGGAVSAKALRRWVSRKTALEPENDWWSQLADIVEDLAVAVGGGRTPSAYALDWIYDGVGARARTAASRINLCTAHAAKGREFQHVVVLDVGDWRAATPEERRLLYVAMTRAKETLTLFRHVPHGNRLLDALAECEGVTEVRPKVVPLPQPAFDRLHRALTLRDVDLSFAGRQGTAHRVHKAIAALRMGEPLQVCGGELRDREGQTVGRLSRQCALPPGAVVHARVAAIVTRHASQSDEKYRAALKVDHWAVVLPEVVIDPATVAAGT